MFHNQIFWLIPDCMYIKVLCLEDVVEDAFLIQDQFKLEGWTINFDHVSNEKEYVEKIRTEIYDVILSDYNLPDFNGISALIHAKKICPLVPFICISGTIGEDLAVEILRMGASDYILKDRLSKLPMAVERVVRESEERKARVEAEKGLRKLSKAVEYSPASIMITSADGTIEYVNPKFTRLTGYEPEEVIGKTPRILKSGDMPSEKYSELWDTILSGREWHGEFKNMKKDGSIYYELASISPIVDTKGQIKNFIAVKEDITDRKNIEFELRKFNLGIENSSDAIFITDINGVIEFVNPAFEKIYGFSGQEAIGKTPRILKSGIIPAEIYKQFWETLLSGKPVKGNIKNKTRDGKIIDIEGSSSSIKDEKGKILGFLSINRDITERILAEEALRKSEEKYRKIFENVQDIFYQVDLRGLITEISPSVLRLAGYTHDELIGKPMLMLYEKPESREQFLDLIEEKGEVWDHEIRVKTKSGEVRYASVNSHKLFDSAGILIGLEGSARDITERKIVEIELLEAKGKAEESSRLKTAFMNNISHELRTPLNGILGFAEFVLQPDITKDEKDYYLDVLNTSSERLLNTITNYMDISLIISGNITTKKLTVNPRSLIESISGKFEPAFRKKGLRFIKHIPVTCYDIMISTDQQLLEKALSQLLDNAVKFTESGSVTLGIRESDYEVEFFVEDTGFGIDIAAQGTVFEYFRQEEIATTRGYEGSGLGLSIAKGLTELMGGKIRLESEKGKGSVFIMTLPKGTTTNAEIASPEVYLKKVNRKGPPVILVVDDDESNSLLFKTILEKYSFHYLLAFDGEEAIHICTESPDIDLVLMDLKMPVIDGFEATRRIKEFRKSLPVIGVTAFAMTGDKEKALAAGCDEYIAKPIKSEVLIAVIRKYLGVSNSTLI